MKAAIKSKGAQLVELRSKKTRETILKAGLDSILSGGVEGFTANELMRRTGLSKGALFHHFSSLDEVATECISLGKYLLHTESRGGLRESLTFMMSSVQGQRRARALNVLLNFLCERARRESRFRKVVQAVNDERMGEIRNLLRNFVPREKEFLLGAAVQFLHSAQMGLVGPAGDCLSNQDRLRAWDLVVDGTVRLLQA